MFEHLGYSEDERQAETNRLVLYTGDEDTLLDDELFRGTLSFPASCFAAQLKSSGDTTQDGDVRVGC